MKKIEVQAWKIIALAPDRRKEIDRLLKLSFPKLVKALADMDAESFKRIRRTIKAAMYLADNVMSSLPPLVVTVEAEKEPGAEGG